MSAAKETLDQWGAALAMGDDAEVDRLVHQSRVDRLHDAVAFPDTDRAGPGLSRGHP